MIEGTDYTVSYKNNKQPGNAEVTVTGCGSYSGILSGTFLITNTSDPVASGMMDYEEDLWGYWEIDQSGTLFIYGEGGLAYPPHDSPWGYGDDDYFPWTRYWKKIKIK